MRLCLLVDALGARSDVQAAAASTWARPGAHVAAVWFVQDSLVSGPGEHPGFAVAEGGRLWLHQPPRPGFRRRERDWRERQEELRESWPPPSSWNETLGLEATVWHVCRRWRLLTASAVLEHLWPQRQGGRGSARCSWLGYFRANSYVDTAALAAVLRVEEARRSGGAPGATPALVLGRGISADMHGVTSPMIDWGGTDLRSVWASSGLLMNQAALKLMIESPGYVHGGGLDMQFVEDLTKWLLSEQNADNLQLSLAKQYAVDGPSVGTIELVFSASLRSQHRELSLEWLPEQRYQFMTEGLFLERFAFRLGAATFQWSLVDQQGAGLSRSRSGRRAACTGLPVHCVVSFYPVDAAALLQALHTTVPRAACLPSADLGSGARSRPTMLRSRFGKVLAWTARGRLFVRTVGKTRARPREAERSPAWCAALRSNRRLWASLVAGPGERRLPGSGRFRLAPRARHAWGLGAGRPATLHADEWLRGPAGQLRLRNTVVVVATLPNSGSTWFLGCMQQAQFVRGGCAAVNSDVLHPYCNRLLSVEAAKVMGAPEDHTWPHILRSAPPPALDLLMELVTDQLHSRAISDLQYMRRNGMTVDGTPLPEALQWPWKGVVARQHDSTRIRLMLTKEVINVHQLMQHVEDRHRSAASPAVLVLVLYRHRAHSFPMSNESELLCKACMFQQLLRSFEAAAFPPASPLARLQAWWRPRARALGGGASPSGLVFAQLVASYALLRAQRFGVRVLDYARLISLERPELEAYLNATLPAPLLRNPGAAAVAASCGALRVARPRAFLERRERAYRALGVEPFARSAVAELRRLDPAADLSLLA